MTTVEIIALVVTFIGVVSFAAVFTILYSSYAHSYIQEIQTGKKDLDLIEDYFYEKQEKVKRKKKIVHIVKSTFFYLALIIIIPVFVFSIFNRINHSATMINNKAIMVVTSGSMSQKNKANEYLTVNHLDNQFNTYDIVVLDKVTSPTQLKQYDIIAFVNDQGINVIHRIVSIENVNGETRYITRGDSNNATDRYQPKFQDIIGKYSTNRVRTLGIFVMFFQSYPGMITVVAVIYCIIMFDKQSSKINAAHQQRIELLEKVIDYNDTIDVQSINLEFQETLYYQGQAYSFNEEGFVGKKEVESSEETSNQTQEDIHNSEGEENHE